jgi:hypothetical protein
MGQVGLVAGYPAGLRLSRDKQTLTGDVRHAKFNGTVAGPGRRGCQRRRAVRGAAHSEVQSLYERGTADVLVESTVAKVCEQRGCWIALKSASSQLHVTFKDEAFFVPASLIGKTVLVQGKLTKAGASYELVASGLQVKS